MEASNSNSVSTSSSSIENQNAKNYGTIRPNNSLKVKRYPGWGARHTFCVMAFFSLLINFSLRVNMSVVIVAMVSSGISGENATNFGTECPFPESFEEQSPVIGQNTGEFEWGPEEQGLVLGSFYYGFIVTQIPGGILSEKFGAKWLLASMTALAGMLTLLNPIAARAGGIGTLSALRVIQGLVQGMLVPATYSMVSKWIPKNEKSQLFNLIWAGFPLANVITLPLSGLIADYFGWEYVFYIFGTLAILFSILWTVLVFDSPNKHPRIKNAEQEYIEDNLPSTTISETKLPFPPWKQILTSLPVWALNLGGFGSAFGFYMIQSEIPTYLSTIQHFSLTSNGFLSALPSLLMIFFSLPAAWLADGLTTKMVDSKGVIRKSFATVALVGPAVCLIGLGFTECNQALAVVWLCLSVMFTGAHNSGMNMNQMELSPNYAGTLRGFTSAFGNITGFVAPLIAGIITTNNQTLAGWRTIFVLTAGIQIISAAIFVIFGKTSVQTWNTYWKTNEEEPMKK